MKEKEIESMRKVFGELKDRIEPLVKSPKIKALQNRVIDIRKSAIDNNEELIAIAKESFKENDIDSVIHFAGLKAVGESMKTLVEGKGAKVVELKEMGQRELAYTIKNYKNGYYFLIVAECENEDAVNEFDQRVTARRASSTGQQTNTTNETILNTNTTTLIYLERV